MRVPVINASADTPQMVDIAGAVRVPLAQATQLRIPKHQDVIRRKPALATTLPLRQQPKRKAQEPIIQAREKKKKTYRKKLADPPEPTGQEKNGTNLTAVTRKETTKTLQPQRGGPLPLSIIPGTTTNPSRMRKSPSQMRLLHYGPRQYDQSLPPLA